MKKSRFPVKPGRTGKGHAGKDRRDKPEKDLAVQNYLRKFAGFFAGGSRKI